MHLTHPGAHRFRLAGVWRDRHHQHALGPLRLQVPQHPKRAVAAAVVHQAERDVRVRIEERQQRRHREALLLVVAGND